MKVNAFFPILIHVAELLKRLPITNVTNITNFCQWTVNSEKNLHVKIASLLESDLSAMDGPIYFSCKQYFTFLQRKI